MVKVFAYLQNAVVVAACCTMNHDCARIYHRPIIFFNLIISWSLMINELTCVAPYFTLHILYALWTHYLWYKYDTPDKNYETVPNAG